MKRYISFALFFLLAFVLNARELKTRDGKIYLDVKIIDTKPHGLDIIHSKGAAFLRFEKLPKDVQKEFNYNPVKAAEYEHKIGVEKDRREKELALKHKNEEEKKKEDAKKRGELVKESNDNIRAKVYSEGIPVKLNRKVLFKLYSGDPIFASSKLLGKSGVYPAYGKYMVVNKKVYLVKNNVIPLPAKLTKLEEDIVKSAKVIDQLQDIVLKCDQIIDDNIKKIREILGNTSVKRSDFYDDKGNYIGTVKTSEELSKNQISLIRSLHFENKDLDNKISRAEKDILHLESNLEEWKEERDIIQKEIDTFKANQKKYLENAAAKKAGEENRKEEGKVPEDLEGKLKKLKEMHEKGLIPKDVYDKKIVEIIDKYVKE